MKISAALMGLTGLSLLAGCTVEPSAIEDFVDESSDAVITTNAITTNAITTNAITTNAITTNAITTNAITTNALAVFRDPSAAGESARLYLQYLVRCSFRVNQSVSFSWTDNGGNVHPETYVGELGLAPEWATGPLSQRGKRMVSGCMAAHVNYYGIHVTLSVRSNESPLRLHPNDDEIDEYSHIEGAFWGNLWAPEPYLHACYQKSNVNHSRERLRDCATGHVNADGSVEDCGMIEVVGPCHKSCVGFDFARQDYAKCIDDPETSGKFTKYVITTALP